MSYPRLGYPCINTQLTSEGITTNRSCILKTIQARNGLKYLYDLYVKNTRDIIHILLWNEQHGIRFFRLSSDIYPHYTNSAVKHKKTITELVGDDLKRAGYLAKMLGHRITMHPNHYAQLGTPHNDVLQKTHQDLEMHAEIFTAMGLTPQMGTVMILHGGGVYEGKPETLKRWAHTWRSLHPKISQYIILENDDYQYTVLDLLPLSEELKIPICIDFFHHECNGGFDITTTFERVIAVWKHRKIKPKCHYSNQKKKSRLGTHDDYIAEIPKVVINYMTKYNVDLMCECKMKEQCVIKLYKRQFTQNNAGEWHFKNH